MSTFLIVVRAVHILSVIAWIGGAISAALVVAWAPSESRAAAAGVARRLLRAVVTPGMVLTWVAGLTMFGLALDVYARAGWMHSKILAAFIAAGLSGALLARVRKTADGAEPTHVARIAALIAVLAVVSVLLVTMGPAL